MYLHKTEALKEKYPNLHLIHVEGVGIRTVCSNEKHKFYRSTGCASLGSPVFCMRQELEATASTVTGIEGMSVRSCQECQVYMQMEEETKQAKAVFDNFFNKIL